MKKYKYVFLFLLVSLVFLDAATCFKPEPSDVDVAMDITDVSLRVKRTVDATSENTANELPPEEEVPVTEKPRASFGNKAMPPTEKE